MAGEFDSEDGADDDAGNKAKGPKPTKNLPTLRVAFEKQLLIYRAVVKASLAVERGGVSNSEVARYAGLTSSSVSNCNGFWIDAGMLTRDGIKIRPVEAGFEYDQAAEWTPDTAFTKLADVLAASWFGKAMLTKLAINKSTSLTDALAFLAQECSASLEYKPQLEVVLAYLAAAKLINIDGNIVTKAVAPSAPPPTEPPPPPTTEPLKGGGGGREYKQQHPFIEGLIQKLPAPDSDWELASRAKWLTTAANIFDLMYKSDEKVGITVVLKGSTLSITTGPTT